MLKIVTIPNPILSTAIKKVERFDSSLKKLIKDMDQTLRSQVNPQGVGLAAPQVGKNLAVFIITPTPGAKTEAFINPKILQVEAGKPEGSGKYASNPHGSKTKARKKTKLEGCLSIPKIWGSVRRAEKVRLQFQDLSGKVNKKWFSGFKAVIIQHEVDHLNGILFTQRALEQNNKLYEEKDGKLKKLEY